jgi:HEAT repeat protein
MLAAMISRSIQESILALRDADPIVRQQAANELAQAGGAAIPHILQAKRNADAELRSNIIHLLCQKRFLLPMIDALPYADPPDRALIVSFLRNHEDLRIAEPVFRAWQARTQEIEANPLDDWSAHELVGELTLIPAYSLALVERGPQVAEWLIQALHSDSIVQRVGALDLLQALKDPRAVGPILDTLRDQDARVRVQAILAVEELASTGLVDSQRAMVALTPLLNDPDNAVRGYALETTNHLKTLFA